LISCRYNQQRLLYDLTTTRSARSILRHRSPRNLPARYGRSPTTAISTNRSLTPGWTQSIVG